MANTTFQLQTLTCPSCIKRIEGAVEAQPGVAASRVLFNSSKVKVEHDASVDADDIKQVIEKLGYEVINEE